MHVVRAIGLALAFVTLDTGPTRADPSSSSVAPNSAAAVLDGAAFANAVGLIRVNEAAGVGNRQINAAAIGRAQTASDAVLATMTSQTVPTTPATARSASNRVTLRAGTFARAAGLIQINQAAGNGNASVNAFALQIHP